LVLLGRPLLHVVLAARSISMKDEKDAIRVKQKALGVPTIPVAQIGQM
jgi:hypothetical protein